jgi:D-serine deaminase-like pyridoxal phosphate-dependent protein
VTASPAEEEGVGATRGPNESLIGIAGSRGDLGTPALVLDLDVMEANIACAARHALTNGYQLRPAAKIHKSIEIAQRQIDAGAVGVCCSTLAECEVMVQAGIPGVMLFTPVVSDPKLVRLAELNACAEGLLVVADSETHVERFAEAARLSGKSLQVLVDVEVGGGRTGLGDPEHAVRLARRVADAPWLEFAGVQGYVGTHQKIVEYEARKARSAALLQPLLRAVEQLEAAGLPPRVVSGGGTGTHDFDSRVGSFSELQLGTYVFMDASYRNVVLRAEEAHPFRPALTVVATVVSDAKPGYVITDVGLKEIDGFLAPDPPVVLRGAPDGATYSIVGDDMGRVEFARSRDRLVPGDVVELMPPRCYQTLCLYSHYHVVRGGDLVDIWPIEARAGW